MSQKQLLPIGISSFIDIRNRNDVYIDKTPHVYRLLTDASRYFFLSRPRRFGKSLLISTLSELWLGNRELFKGLWIERETDWPWYSYPVIRLDFAQIPHQNSKKLHQALNEKLLEIGISFGLHGETSHDPEITLRHLVEKLVKKYQKKVVLLIDEYDKPIIDNLSNITVAEANRDVLKSFYDTVKSISEDIQFLLITGITKFAKTSIFSGLNNVNDITFKPLAATLCGYTEEEITTYLSRYVSEMAEEIQSAPDSIRAQLKYWYNGYQFSKLPTKVYNPFSILFCLNDKDFANYWFSTGTPSFLIKFFKTHYNELVKLGSSRWEINEIETFELDNINPITLLLQTG